MKPFAPLIYLVLCALFLSALSATSLAADNSHALSGVREGKVVFDINIPGQMQKMALYLQVIAQTKTDLEQAQVKPDIILAFRGAAVKFLLKEQPEDMALDDSLAHEKFVALLNQLMQQGVRVESCSVATGLFGIDNSSLLPGVVPVGNTFASLVGYQAKGYGTIPVY
ncbi:MAG: DsrE family protein [Gammaproteobacteria bacterium SHHR-1]|uniref:DsrE family protein n=1 Tax=Magnetovirga frankeli TaxID=947516 RepID=UPI001292FA6A|nr:DsrE family protein [gamma proteobacterium SS-5]